MVNANGGAAFSGSGPLAFLLTLALALRFATQARAEDTVAYRYEDYQEEGGRVRVHTQTAYFETALDPRVAFKGEFVYDSISGATPTGAPAPAGGGPVPLVELKDTRYSGNISSDIKLGRTTTTPGFAYSTESDYQSVGLSLNEAIDFNSRNTTLNLGVAHNFDKVSGFFQQDARRKDSTDVLIGLNQLLGPHTYVTANLTLGYADGYLTDPFKVSTFLFNYPLSFYDPPDSFVVPERRPDHKFREVALVGITQYFDAVQASLEASYRFHHDSWGIFSHTVELSWHQKLGKKLMISPLFRFYNQSAATFYAPSFTGDPSFPDGTVGSVQADGSSIVFNDDPAFPGTGTSTFTVPGHPTYFSSDYRLSQFNSYTYGVTLSWRVQEHFSIEAGYKRYEMQGLDGITSLSAYPKAH
ncbi:MAG TPA: DUF3570 domain-containing protein, partial [Candidatus Limnocylindria bacterium]|nr:DUF3570 domain-containing protein [Candidatus Limnocylindria bacterium]